MYKTLIDDETYVSLRMPIDKEIQIIVGVSEGGALGIEHLYFEVKCSNKTNRGEEDKQVRSKIKIKRIIKAAKRTEDISDRDVFSVSPADIFGMKVNSLRRNIGCSLEEFSALSNLSQDDIVAIEAGLESPNRLFGYIDNLQRAFDKKIDIRKVFVDIVLNYPD